MKLSGPKLLLTTAALWAFSIVFALPLVWMVSTSLKTDDRVQSDGLSLVPRASFLRVDGQDLRVRPLASRDGRQQVMFEDGPERGNSVWVGPDQVVGRLHLHTSNYADAVRAFPFGRYLLNTLVLCGLSVIGTVLSCSLVAYGLACVLWRGRETLFAVMLATMMLPSQTTMIPLFLTFKQLGWIDTILPLVVPTFCGNAAFIFLLRQFYRSIPPSLLEAARLDGCSDFGIWRRVVVPLSKPALMTVTLYTFIASWNDFLGPLIYLMHEEKYTLAVGLASFQGQYGTNWGQMMAASLLMTLPIIALFIFTQRSFLQGVKLAGMKE
ncbi:MAG: carbohydrate ABC transporter permease [Tepidisphaeraceae bacterium]